MFVSCGSNLIYFQIRWNDDQQSGVIDEQDRILHSNPHGFGSISRRQSVKPIIAAVNGGAYGGGMEMVLNCDIVIAASDAKFALPEVKRGVVAAQGGTYLFRFPVISSCLMRIRHFFFRAYALFLFIELSIGMIRGPR